MNFVVTFLDNLVDKITKYFNFFDKNKTPINIIYDDITYFLKSKDFKNTVYKINQFFDIKNRNDFLINNNNRELLLYIEEDIKKNINVINKILIKNETETFCMKKLLFTNDKYIYVFEDWYMFDDKYLNDKDLNHTKFYYLNDIINNIPITFDISYKNKELIEAKGKNFDTLGNYFKDKENNINNKIKVNEVYSLEYTHIEIISSESNYYWKFDFNCFEDNIFVLKYFLNKDKGIFQHLIFKLEKGNLYVCIYKKGEEICFHIIKKDKISIIDYKNNDSLKKIAFKGIICENNSKIEKDFIKNNLNNKHINKLINPFKPVKY